MWKWVAGSPDATDWNAILQSQEKVIENNGHQYEINEKLFGLQHDVLQRINQIVNISNIISKSTEEANIEQKALLKLIVLKEEVYEIVRACQLAKRGIVDSNILDKEELHRILAEMETLPYQNVIEAVEYGSPSIFSNGTHLLYILSMPKLGTDEYHMLRIRAAIPNERQVAISFNKILLNQRHTFGVIGTCLSIGNSTICDMTDLKRIPEDDCPNKILKGGNAACNYKTSHGTIVELIKEDTIFVTNFVGEMTSDNHNSILNGTYILKINNETVFLNNQSFSSHTMSSLQALPPALVKVTNSGMRVDLEYLHDLGLRNIKHLDNLKEKMTCSFSINGFVIICVLCVVALLWMKLTRNTGIPKVRIPDNSTLPTSNAACDYKLPAPAKSAGRRSLRREELAQAAPITLTEPANTLQ